jgi:calcium-dependent protein kinase
LHAHRYLLKLRAEVEVMQQLGVSLNAVHLHDVFEDDVNVHMVMELCEGGALLERVESGRYSERYISFLVRSILRFIAQCHAKVGACNYASGVEVGVWA